MTDREPLTTALMRALRAAIVFGAHVALGIVVAIGVWGTERVFALLFGQREPKFFDWIPVKWFAEAGEAGVMIVFVVFGIYEAYKNLKR